MAPIKFKEVVTYSSQDGNHRAENLLKAQTQWNRWLSSLDDKSGCIQVEIQLERAEDIGFIDIGNYCSSTVEIQVRRSYDTGFRALLPATMFRTIEESRQGRNKNGVRMFTKEHFVEGVRDQKWDTVKIICRELSRKVNQFGLAFVSLSSVKENIVQKVDTNLVAKSQEKAAIGKGKQPKRSSNIIPAWKKDTSFYRQYLEKNTASYSVKPDLKDMILKMSSTSEDGLVNEQSCSRSTKMLLAASSNTNPNKVAKYQPAGGDTTPLNEVKDGLVQFRRKLQNFIRKEGQSIANASMKGLRAKFEEQLGYKMDKMTKLEFKVALLRAAESLMSSKKSPAKDITVKRPPINRKETPEQKQLKKSKAASSKRKIFPEKKKTTKSLPASAYRNCPRCFRKFTANQINLHIANCVPDHQQIARAALGAISENGTPSTLSIKTQSVSYTTTYTERKGPTGKEKKAPTRKKAASGQKKPKRCGISKSSASTSIKEPVKQSRDSGGCYSQGTAGKSRDSGGCYSQSTAGNNRNSGGCYSQSTVGNNSGGFFSIKVNDSSQPSNSQDHAHSWAAPSASPDLIQCPICCDSFDVDFIEIHASTCGVCYYSQQTYTELSCKIVKRA